MEFFNTYFLDIIKNKYALFNGRARRKEFWMFYLVWVIITLGINIIGIILGGLIANFLFVIFSIIDLLFILGTIVPHVALCVRRIHDTNHSGWWIIVPFANLLLFLEKGTEGDNQYGPDPKAGE